MWHFQYSKQHKLPFFQLVERCFQLTSLPNWPNTGGLNSLVKQLGVPGLPTFVDQDSVNSEWGYYEQIIAERRCVPTRADNWHDLFNALIWMQFPQSKWLLNRLHLQQIQQHGLTPRTPVRDRVTHFDECGLVLATTDSEIPGLLAEHQWQQAFVQNRCAWGQRVQVFVFGHAIYEMLLSPFIGLTGKWLAIEVDKDFMQLPGWQQLSLLDQKLVEKIDSEHTFAQKKSIKPLPLLGIPGWHPNQDASFYANTNYFMPKKPKGKTLI